MGVVAKGSITLTAVSDTYSVSLSPSSCIINTDYNGKNPNLDYAYTDITVYRGEIAVPSSKPLSVMLELGADYYIEALNETTWRVWIKAIPANSLNGSFQFEIYAGESFHTKVSFYYSVIRKASMFDWILDWNGTYTEIGGKWIITPKIFAGTKNADNEISGVYLGPSMEGDGSLGVYGYKNNEIIFRLTENGGLIGGWSIEKGGIQTSDGYLKLLSEGSIISSPKGELAWGLYKDGSAVFANGNVKFQPDGSATFKGHIETGSGQIGGWSIGNNSIYSEAILINSSEHFIGIRNVEDLVISGEPNSETFYNDLTKTGGVALFYTNNAKFGIEGWQSRGRFGSSGGGSGWLPGLKVFSLGSENLIAGWKFDNNSLYMGDKVNTARQNTSEDGEITIGSAGLRGRNWYIDSDGEISFLGGLLHFTKEGGSIAGWDINSTSLVSEHTALFSIANYGGLYLSSEDFTGKSLLAISNLITTRGGIQLQSSEQAAALRTYASIDGSVVKTIELNSSGVSHIASWSFDNVALYIGTQNNTKDQFTPSAGSITLGDTGIRGWKWRLEADGSGGLADNNITWDSEGNVRFSENVWLSWDSKTGTGTRITSDGMFTGTISGDKVKAGTISTSSIECDGKWILNSDGSGSLASGKIEWTSDGVLTINGILNSPWVAKFGSSWVLSGSEDNEWVKDFKQSQSQWTNLIISPDDLMPVNLLGGDSKENIGRLVRLINPYSNFVYLIDRTDKIQFAEGGRLSDDLYVFSSQIVELIGYDSGNGFKWLILNRRYLNPSVAIGTPASILASGRINVSGGNIKLTTYSTFDGSELSVESAGTANQYRINIPASWGLSSNNYYIKLIDIGSTGNFRVISLSSTNATISCSTSTLDCAFEIVPIHIFPYPRLL